MLGFGAVGKFALGQLGSPSTGALFPSLYTNTNTFYTPKVSFTLKPSLFTNTNTFYTPRLKLYLTPSLFSNTAVFYTPLLIRGLLLEASLYSNTNAFYTSKLSFRLYPDLLSNTNTFYSEHATHYLYPPPWTTTYATITEQFYPALVRNKYTPHEGYRRMHVRNNGHYFK